MEQQQESQSGADERALHHFRQDQWANDSDQAASALSRWLERFAALRDWFGEHLFAVGILIALALALLAEMPWVGRPIRAHLLQALVVGFAIFVALAGRAQENLRQASGRGASPWLIALIAWCAFETFLPPSRLYHGGAGAASVAALLRPFAVAELLRMLFCASLFFAAAYGLKTRDIRPVVYGMLGMGAAVALYGLSQFGTGSETGLSAAKSIFGNHEQVGSYLMLMLPVALALALSQTMESWAQLSAQALSVVLAGAILLTRTRSAWIGELAALITVAGINLRTMSVRVTKANKFVLIGPVLILCIGFALLVFSNELSPLLSQRATSFAHVVDDGSFADRLHRWKSACRMAYERPVAGWGLGSFPVLQSRWTGQGDPPAIVIARGTGHINLAHNFWVQWAAETGGVGVALYAATMAAFLISAGRRLKPAAEGRSRGPGPGPGSGLSFDSGSAPIPTSGFHRKLLIGCVASVVGACADMTGAPSYTFSGVSALPWLWMGLGVAACRNLNSNSVLTSQRSSSSSTGADAEAGPGRAERANRAALSAPTPIWDWAAPAIVGAAVAAAILVIGHHQPAVHYTLRK